MENYEVLSLISLGLILIAAKEYFGI